MLLDRAALEVASCECHGTVRALFDRQLGPPTGKWVRAGPAGPRADRPAPGTLLHLMLRRNIRRRWSGMAVMTRSPGGGGGRGQGRREGPDDVPRTRAGSPWSCAGPEPTLDEALGDSIVHLLLRRDRLTDADVRAAVERARARLTVAAGGSVRAPTRA